MLSYESIQYLSAYFSEDHIADSLSPTLIKMQDSLSSYVPHAFQFCMFDLMHIHPLHQCGVKNDSTSFLRESPLYCMGT